MKETLGHLIIKPYSRGETQAIKKFNGWFQVENEEHNEKNDDKEFNRSISRIQDYLSSQARAVSLTPVFSQAFSIHVTKKNSTQILEPVLHPSKVFTFLFLRQSVLSFYQSYNTLR